MIEVGWFKLCSSNYLLRSVEFMNELGGGLVAFLFRAISGRIFGWLMNSSFIGEDTCWDMFSVM